MRLIKNLIAKWSKPLGRYVILAINGVEYEGPVAYAFGGGGGGTETVPTGPFGPQIPFIMELFNQAAQIFQQGPPQFPNFPTVAQPGQDLLASQAGIAGAVPGNAAASGAGADLALGAAQGAGQNPVSGVANPLAPDLTQGLLQLLQSGANPLTQQGAATQPGATGAINTATGGVQGPQAGINTSGGPSLPGAGIDINSILQQNLGGSGLNPFIEDTVGAATRGLVNNFQRNIIPSIGDAAGAAGQPGGTRQGIAQGIAAGDLQQNIADVTAQLFAQGFDRNIGVQQTALSQVGGAQQAQAQAQLQTGDINEQIRNAMLGQALQGAQLSQQGTGQGIGLGQSGVSTGTSQVGNLLQAGNAQGLSQLFGGLGLLPSLQGNQLAQFGALNQSGLQQLGLEQSNIDAAMQEFFFNEFGPINALTQFQNFISGPFGGSVGGNAANTDFPGTGGLNLPPGVNAPNPNTGDIFGGQGKPASTSSTGAQPPAIPGSGGAADIFGGGGKGGQVPGQVPGAQPPGTLPFQPPPPQQIPPVGVNNPNQNPFLQQLQQAA